MSLTIAHPLRLKAVLGTFTAIVVLGLSNTAFGQGPFLNGFDLAESTIPVSEIVRGGPPRDGIPAIDNPKFLLSDAAQFLSDDELVIGLTRNGITRAYPLRIMLWHEVVNDTFGEEPVAVTYCPLCGTAVAFEAMIKDHKLTFGVSGLLFQSDVLMYDRQTESLWSQLLLKSVTGEQVGQPLTILPSRILTWGAWRKKFPGSEVLSTDTGFSRNYERNPYAGYESNQEIWFGVPLTRDEFKNKDLVLGVLIGEQAKAYAIPTLEDAKGLGPFHDVIGGVPIRFSYDRESREATMDHAETGEPISFIQSFWFAWQAFYPETEIWQPIKMKADNSGKLHISGETGKKHIIERSNDFKTWIPVGSLILSDETFVIDAPTSGHATEFYRVQREP
jgi:hypothetical protein